MQRNTLLYVLPGVALATQTTTGCTRQCGRYTSLTGLEMVVGQDVYDYDRDDMFESCGEIFGAFGEFAIDDGELGTLVFLPDHRNMEIDTHICTSLYYHVWFDNRTLVVGGELTITDAEAGIYAVQAVPLVEGTVEVLDSKDPDEECAPFRKQDYELRWDLVYEDPGATLRYTAQGQDWVGIGLPMSSDDPGC